MCRMVIAQHGDDLFVASFWWDGHGMHQRRCTEEMGDAEIAAVRTILDSDPTVLRWQLDDEPGRAIAIGRTRHGDTGPTYNGSPIKKAVKDAADMLLSWCGDYCASWQQHNDDYEEARNLARIADHLEQRRAHLGRRERP